MFLAGAVLTTSPSSYNQPLPFALGQVGWADLRRATGASRNESRTVREAALRATAHLLCQESSRSVLPGIYWNGIEHTLTRR